MSEWRLKVHCGIAALSSTWAHSCPAAIVPRRLQLWGKKSNGIWKAFVPRDLMDIGLYSSWAATIVGVHLNHWQLLIHQEGFHGCCNWAHYLESSQKPEKTQIYVVPLTAFWSWMTFFSPSLSCLAPAGLKSKSSPFFVNNSRPFHGHYNPLLKGTA